MAKVTIKEIAQRAGVSKTAVSFALNDPSRLSETTLQRILSIAEELGYTPDPIARSMTTKRIGCIGLLVPQPIPDVIRNPFFSEFLEGIGEVCREAGLSLMLVPPLKGSMRRAVNDAAVDGFLTLGLETFRGTMMILEQRGVPYVMVDSDPTPDIPCVNIDDQGGARAAMAHVLQAGHRRIAILGIRSGKQGRYKEYAGTLRRRMEGYLAALNEAGLSMHSRDVHLVECDAHVSGGREGFQQLWRLKRQPTAIVAMSDIIAIGAMEAAREFDIRVPDDVSIVGYDDIPAARWTQPRLTTVHQPIREKGKLAAELLVKLVGGETDNNHYVLPTNLVKRESVRIWAEETTAG
ncbi:MAG: LacI family transcriptional regulator [Anaerolineae bacterium]|jgi:alanine racemase|nr:LacI family transcriptional regulator [Anaerolineae bacterium]MDH7473876.1 LacI family DNA-binding transcriptional regulator [Anaerolineae bacterium]